jgi:hypothetical protein
VQMNWLGAGIGNSRRWSRGLIIRVKLSRQYLPG